MQHLITHGIPITNTKINTNGTQDEQRQISWKYDGAQNFQRPDNDVGNNANNAFCNGNDKTYHWTINGDNQTHLLEFQDGWYGDNSGSLDFKIYELNQQAPTYIWSTGETCIHFTFTNPNHYVLCNGKQWYNHLSRQCSGYRKQPNSRKYTRCNYVVAGATSYYISDGDTAGTWYSSNPSIATINPSTGEVNAIADGTTTIGYVVRATGPCADDTATLTLTVDAQQVTTSSGGTVYIVMVFSWMMVER